MKRKKAGILIGALTLVISMNLNGCANNPQTSSSVPEASKVTLELPKESEPEMLSSDSALIPEDAAAPPQTDSGNVNAASDSATSADELRGNIEQIGSDSFIISKIFTEDIGDGTMLAVSPGSNAPDSEKTLITVSFTDSTKFIIRTVVNGGVNPSDPSDSPATKDNLEIGVSLDIKGNFSDAQFYADEIIIYNIK